MLNPCPNISSDCFLHVYPNVDFRSPVGDGLPAELLFRSCLGGTHGHYPLASDCDDTPGSEPYRKPRGIYAGRDLVPSCRSPNHLVISMHKRKNKRSCCQLLFLVSWIYGTTTVARRAYNEMTMLSKPKHPHYSLLDILPLDKS